MEEKLKRKPVYNMDKISKNRYTELDNFSKKLAEKYGNLVSSIIVKKIPNIGETIPLLLFIDDLNNTILNPQVSEIKLDALEIAYSSKISLDCEVMLASEFWEKFKSKDENALQLAREAIVFKDNGFFSPIQSLLLTGKVRPSKESLRVYFLKAETSLKNSNQKVSKAVLDLYWAVIDAAHAAVMVAGITPPSPKHLSETFKKELIVRNLIHKRTGEIVERFYNIAKKIMHKEVFEISGREFDAYLSEADFFIKEVNAFVKSHMKNKV